MPKPEKVAAVAELAEMFSATDGIYLADFTGLKVAQVNELRKRLRERGVSYLVVKNTLASIAAQQSGREALVPYLAGPTAVAIATKMDPVDPARVLAKFAKDHEVLSIKAGFVEGRLFATKEVQRLAALPGRQELYAKLLGALQFPAAGLVGCLTGVMRNLVSVLSEIEKKKQAES